MGKSIIYGRSRICLIGLYAGKTSYSLSRCVLLDFSFRSLWRVLVVGFLYILATMVTSQIGLAMGALTATGGGEAETTPIVKQ